MVVIVGDEDAAGTASRRAWASIGPSLDLSRASIEVAKLSAAPYHPIPTVISIIGAGDTVSYSFPR